MDRKDFTNPNGIFEEIERGGLAFIPNKLPPKIQYDQELAKLTILAERNVARLRGIGETLPDPRVLIRAYLKVEAVQSSRIEGTMASLEDLNKSEVAGKPEEAEQLRLREVVNYVEAQKGALDRLRGGGKIDMNLVLDAHKKIMRRVRGGDKSPGKFRNTQNWIIGGRNNIIYTPPPPSHVPKMLDDLEAFIREEHDISPLIKCAIVHYQFEAIHPFRDGNGRTGRLLLPLLLYEAGLMPSPLLYLSPYFEDNLSRYRKGLLDVSQKSDWKEWISFFLEAFAEQASSTIMNIEKMQEIHNRYKNLLKQKEAAPRAILLTDYLIENTYITIPRAQSYLGTSYPTARNTVQALLDAGILEEIGNVKGKKVYRAPEMAAVLEK